MKKKRTYKLRSRLLSGLMAFLMLVTLVPVSEITSYAADEASSEAVIDVSTDEANEEDAIIESSDVIVEDDTNSEVSEETVSEDDSEAAVDEAAIDEDIVEEEIEAVIDEVQIEKVASEGSELVNKDYLCFTAEEAKVTLSINKTGSPESIDLQVLKTGELNPKWTSYTIGDQITLDNIGDKVYFRATSTNSTFSYDVSNYYQFIMGDAKVAASGNIMSLLDIDCLVDSVSSYAFCNMFYECSSLTSAPSLPATTLEDGCYYQMFYGCSSLTSAPSLPAATLAYSCYDSMFYECSSLTSAPSLPATTLADDCYSSMFEGCSSLTSAPSLPATTLADHCYYYMFGGCIILTSAPSLPATTLADYCYSYMFEGCSILTSAPSLPATTLADSCYESMFQNCKGLTSAPSLPATTLADSCYESMFYDCSSLTSVPELPATTLAYKCYYYMFCGCTSLETVPLLPAKTLAEECYSSMFQNCTTLTVVPGLPATTPEFNCYASMFNGCSSLVLKEESDTQYNSYFKLDISDTYASQVYNWAYDMFKDISAASTYSGPPVSSACYVKSALYPVFNNTAEADKQKNHGYITVDKGVGYGTNTVYINPNAGYRLDTLTITTAEGNTITPVIGVSRTTATFEATNDVMYITATFKYSGVCDHTKNTNTMTDCGNGKHSGTCSICDTILTENHVDENNDGICDKCGVVYRYVVASYVCDTEGNPVALDISGLGAYDIGTEVTIEAPSSDAYRFIGWYSYVMSRNGKIEYDDSMLCDSRAYTFTPVSDVELVAVYEAKGSILITVKGGSSFTINGTSVTKDAEAEAALKSQEFVRGSEVTLVSTDDSFEYWANEYGMKLSSIKTYTFIVTGKATITAVTNKVEESKVTLVFESYYGQIMARKVISDSDGLAAMDAAALAAYESANVPSLPVRYGYTASGWDYNGDGIIDASDNINAAVTIAKEKTDRKITIKPVYAANATTYTVTVTNGTGTGTYAHDAVVTVEADAPGTGEKFSHWVMQDSTGADTWGEEKLVSYNKKYQFFATKKVRLTAVYVADSVVVEVKGTTAIIESARYDEKHTATFVSMSTVPEGCTINYAGIIATNNATKAANLTASNADYVRGDAWTGNAYRYTWTKLNVQDSDTWYARAYLVYTDADGKICTVYGDVVSLVKK